MTSRVLHGGMNAVKEVEQVESGGPQSHSAGSTEGQRADSPKQPKPILSRCAGCYNHNRNSMARWGGNGESSSSAEDSGPEVDLVSETESSSSSIYSEEALPETPGDAAEAESGGKDGDSGREAAVTASQEDKSSTNAKPRRAPLIKSSSFPTSLTPHLVPVSLLPRLHTVVSTLHLQVLSQKHHHHHASHIVKQQLSGREEEKTGASNGGGINCVKPPQPWQPTLQQHQLSYQQQPQHFSPLSAQGQRLPPPLHTLPVPHPLTLHPPGAHQTHLHAPTPQPCCWCYSMHCPYTYHTH